ncbi:MAG TPA: EamA family transporter [Candidatus Sulfotelmatobacter sp.]|jgi:drug/metabolite transporter (DMT)-like permease|nr:EamA family transporter [Candidatus Sulfotelmatobacter sp.]
MTTFQIAGIWALNILLDTSGHFAFKLAAIEPDAQASNLEHWKHMLARPWLWLGAFCFVGEFVAWLAFLSLVPLAQGVLLGMVSIVVMMICGRIAFRERLTRPRIIGMLLIIAGVAVVGVG